MLNFEIGTYSAYCNNYFPTYNFAIISISKIKKYIFSNISHRDTNNRHSSDRRQLPIDRISAIEMYSFVGSGTHQLFLF
jgi:hypothetical protein